MDLLPLLLIGGGATIFGLLGWLFVAIQRAKKQTLARAEQLLRLGATPKQAQQQLADEGHDLEDAAEMVRKAVAKSLRDAAAAAVARSGSETPSLDARRLPWGRRHPVLCFFLGVPLVFLGCGVLIASLIVRDGNLTGKFVTFPFAGAVTRMLGIFIFVIGLTLVVVPFTKWGEEGDEE